MPRCSFAPEDRRLDAPREPFSMPGRIFETPDEAPLPWGYAGAPLSTESPIFMVEFCRNSHNLSGVHVNTGVL